MKSIIISALRATLDTGFLSHSNADEGRAMNLAEYLYDKGVTATVDEISEEEDDRGDEGIYKTVTRKLVIEGMPVAEWTICAYGRYINDKNCAPHLSVGWNVEEDTSGGDGIPSKCALRSVLELFDLDAEATDCPDIDEPAGAKWVTEDEAQYAVMVRNRYTQWMEDYDPISYHASREEAQKAMAASQRDFAAANSANSYGPEWAIGTRDESGSWAVEEEEYA